jgi:hypothetical protein
MNRIKLVAILAVLGIATFVAISSIYTVSEVEQAIITQFGQPIGAPVTAAGLRSRSPSSKMSTLWTSEFSSGTAIRPALTDVTLVPVDEKQFLFMVSRTPYFALNVMRALARRLRATNSAL